MFIREALGLRLSGGGAFVVWLALMIPVATGFAVARPVKSSILLVARSWVSGGVGAP